MAQGILRWGLVGTARINRAVIPPLRHSPRNTLVAVASRTAERAATYAREWQIPRAFGSYESLLADPDIDVVYNPLPNSLHAEWTIAALRAGKHVLCEKPLTLSVEDVDAIATAARQADRVVTEAFMYRHHPQTLEVKRLLDDGAIGSLRLVRGAFTFTVRQTTNVRLDPALGGGSLWDVGCYPVSWARVMAGTEPIEVFGWARVGPSGVDETFVGQMRFPDGILAQFDSGLASPWRTHVEMVGSEGSIAVARPFKPLPRGEIVLTRGETVETLETAEQELYLGEIEDMADAVLDGRAPRIPLSDSRHNVAAVLALLRSAAEGRPVLLP